MIAEGTFKARGVEAELGTTDGGKDQVAVLIELVEGDDIGQRITWHGYFTEAAMDRTLESLRLLGWQGDDLSDLSGIDSNEVFAVIVHEEYDGKTRAKVNWINGNAGIALKNKMNTGDAKAFAERMKGHVLAHKAKNATSAPASSARPATRPAAKSAPNNSQQRRNQPNDFTPAPVDDEIPF